MNSGRIRPRTSGVVPIVRHDRIPNKEYVMRNCKKLLERDFFRRFHSLYIPDAIAKGMAHQISTWDRANGPEWSIKRLKALKVDYIQLLAGNKKVSNWIGYRNGVPIGPFGRLFRFGLERPDDAERQSRVLNALNCYTAYLSSVDLDSQLSKFYDALEARPIPNSVTDEIVLLTKPIAERISVDTRIQLQTVKDYVPRQSKRAPSSDGRTVPEKEWFDTISCIWETRLGSDLWYNFTQLREVLNPIAKVVESRLRDVPSWLKAGREIQSQGFAGKIGHIQEPGFKLRAVANPFRVYQLALSRLGGQLYGVVKKLKWDCTHNQIEGAQWSQRKLNDGHTMFAVDLSNATDRFPLSVQIGVLRHITGIHIEDIMLLERLATASWLSPTHGLVTWKKGQPLGLYPSFALFTLTHGIILRSLEQRLGITDSFRVLGDDVVISDPRLHSAYREVLLKLEVPVAEEKTLVSDKITEFAGKVISRGFITSVGKWRSVSDRNFMELLKNIGPRFLTELQPRQRRVAQKVMMLPAPIGMEWNPSGIPLRDRDALIDQLLYLYESKVDLPRFQEQSWPRAMMNSSFVSHLFDGHPLEGGWTANQHRHGSPDPSGFLELHSNLKRVIGVTPSPDRQLRDLASRGVDVSVLAKRLGAVLGMVPLETTSDPRGSTELQLWEQRLKAD